MAILQGCCCTQSVRRGSYASGLYSTAYFLVTLIMTVRFIYDERHYFTGKKKNPTSESVIQTDKMNAITVGFHVAVLVCACLGFLSSLLLLYGLHKDKQTLLLPWMAAMLVTALVDAAHIFTLIIMKSTTFNPESALLYTVDFFLVCLNTYALLCVASQYQEYKAGRGTARDDQPNGWGTAVRYVSQPTATSVLSTRRGTRTTLHDTRTTPSHSPTTEGAATPGSAAALGPSTANGTGSGGLAGGGSGDLLTVPGPPLYPRRPLSLKKHVQFPEPSDTNHSESSDNAVSSISGGTVQNDSPGDEQALLVPTEARSGISLPHGIV